MAVPQRRTFRIEAFDAPVEGPCPDANGVDIAGQRHHELMKTIAALRGVKGSQAEPEHVSDRVLEDYKARIAETFKLKDELDEITQAIDQTKREIATLHHTGFKGPEMHRVTDELDAIVTDTEQATDSILHSAEVIDRDATDLAAALKSGSQHDQACDIQEQVVKIFESCNFQDLTGQRITKIVNALRFIEDRVHRMMEIWGGLEKFEDIEPHPKEDEHPDDALLNGPALSDDEGVATQDEIDALFD